MALATLLPRPKQSDSIKVVDDKIIISPSAYRVIRPTLSSTAITNNVVELDKRLCITIDHTNLITNGYTYYTHAISQLSSHISQQTSTNVSLTDDDINIIYHNDRDAITITTNYGVIGVVSGDVHIRERLRQIIQENMAPAFHKRQGLIQSITPQEEKARATLREMLTESEWRRYITNGFIMVKGPSSDWYQVFAKHSERIRVYRRGKYIQNLCIHSDNNVPATDHVINMKVLIELDEQSVWDGANKYQPALNYSLQNQKQVSILEWYSKNKPINQEVNPNARNASRQSYQALGA